MVEPSPPMSVTQISATKKISPKVIAQEYINPDIPVRKHKPESIMRASKSMRDAVELQESILDGTWEDPRNPKQKPSLVSSISKMLGFDKKKKKNK